MSVRVQLDPHNGNTYTNLDFVTGRVLLTLPTDASISAITVKLEAESKTRLEGPRSPNDQDRRKTLLEVHKLLYKVETVFPSQEIRDVSGPNAKSSQYTIPRGQYEYPFTFKIPFNTDCVSNTSIMKDLRVGQLNVQFGQEPQHRKGPLPPSLSGYPGEAEIKYYVKATVVRPKFYQENLRNEIPIPFMPIERPRPSQEAGELYGRRKHQFQQYNGQQTKRRSLFRQASVPAPAEEEPLAFQVDARLPNPAIITCREPIPLRILIDRLNNSSSSIFLNTLQIELIGHTEVRAYDLQRKESNTLTIFSQANMNLALEHPAAKRYSWIVPSRFWDQIPLPSTIAPTFSTCNISQTYELEVRVGLSSGSADGMRPEMIISPIRLNVEVWSGIPPPAALLQRLQQSQEAPVKPPRADSYPIDSKDSTLSNAPSAKYTAPTSPPPTASKKGSEHVLTHRPAVHETAPDSTGQAQWTHSPTDDLPPSYEDAMADEISPVNGPQHDHSVADQQSNGNGNTNSTPVEQSPFNPDSKSPSGISNIGRRVSERLFSQNSPKPPDSQRKRLSRNRSTVQNDGNSNSLPEEQADSVPNDAELEESSIPRKS